MIPWPLSDSVLGQLCRLVAELEAVADGGSDLSEFVENASLPAVTGATRRTVDALARYSSAGVDHTRVIERQKRGRQIDQQFLDATEKKAREIGADRITVVSDAGYVHDIVSRIERSKVLSGAQYGKPVMSQWPIDQNGILATIARKEAPPEPVVLLPALTLRRLGSSEQHLVLIGAGEESKTVVAAMIPRRPDDRGNHHVSLWILAGEQPFREGKATVHVTMPDGSPRMVVSAGRPVPVSSANPGRTTQ